jgi:pyruvate carboxylase
METTQRKRFKKILVANRGEIAIRIMRAASELELRTIAVYTYEDRYSLHRYKADEAYQIGRDDEPLKPYLDIEEIIRVAKANDADAIHPGYGFLSENVNFARRCEEEGIVFVGPEPEVMEQLGDKMAAKKLARRVGVPLIEDSRDPLLDEETVLREAKRIGFPVMIKAAAGGGGRGMRVVRNKEELIPEYREARREAMTAFGDDSVFLEKFIDRPKHIEVQILGDKHGNIVHLYERDCSVQRRFQKVVEIAPCLTLDQEIKDKIYQYALDLARAVNYSCAGTVEFLVDQEQNVYFIEVNPRIQVEHTITEEITGVDIVRSQILISMGYPLDHPTIFIQGQDDIKVSGFAIQCRITTEDPSNDFKPDYGTLIAYRSAAGMGIRLDAGSAFPGAKISPFFDSLLVKVTAWGRTMKGASQRLHRALREFRIRGVKTNVGFLLNLLEDETFQEGKATVNYIKENPQLMAPPNWRDRSTKMLRYLANVVVNGNPDVKFKDPHIVFSHPHVPAFDDRAPLPKGTRDLLREMGREKFVQWLKDQKPIQYTDTTFRDAHQSLLATRMRTYDMEKAARSFAFHHADSVFSMEVWGGATFDVALRFLKEDPWDRLIRLRKAIPNILFQMLLRGSNAVGYTAYPDNLIIRFIEEAADAGIDIFRIFDSLNWVEAMKTSIRAVRERTDAIAEVCLCYTGDIMDPDRKKFTLQYYLDLAKRLEDEGAHMIAVKDMAGLLKPLAAELLVSELKNAVSLPIHLHTHDTSSIQAATYLKAIEAGVDVVDVALGALSGLTSQPNFNSIVAMMKGHERELPVDLHSLNRFSNYWEAVRRYYYPFETELRAGTAEVYEHEIPGGQYSNLRPQARALGLEEQFETVKGKLYNCQRAFRRYY